MSLIISNKNTLNNTYLITINNAESAITEENHGDLTIIKSGNKVVGLNVRNSTKYFSVEEGAHTLKSEQADAIKKLGYEIKDYSSRFIVGKVIKKEVHPKSDRLFVLKVKADKELQIVTNAKNVNIEKKVVVAKVGATLASGKSIILSKVFGIDSEGMLCREETLGKKKTEGVLLVRKKKGPPFIL